MLTNGKLNSRKKFNLENIISWWTWQKRRWPDNQIRTGVKNPKPNHKKKKTNSIETRCHSHTNKIFKYSIHTQNSTLQKVRHHEVSMFGGIKPLSPSSLKMTRPEGLMDTQVMLACFKEILAQASGGSWRDLEKVNHWLQLGWLSINFSSIFHSIVNENYKDNSNITNIKNGQKTSFL